MAWGRIDDKLHSHPKTIRIPRAHRCEAIGLWTLANSWCNDHQTDGLVPRDMVDEFGTSLETAQFLVAAEMWIEVKKGFQVANWDEYNFTSAQLQEKREAEAERKRKWRDSKKAKSEGSPSNVPAGQAGQSQSVQPESPLSHTRTHTHTQEKEEIPSPPAAKSNEPDRFLEFWQTYPRRQGRGEAIKSYAKALKKIDAETLIEAARNYANDPNRDPGFTAMAATWLNQERWQDDPLPARNGKPNPTQGALDILEMGRQLMHDGSHGQMKEIN